MKNVLDLLDEIRSIAQLGLYYTKDSYDIDRYNRLLNIATAKYAELTDLPSLEIKHRFSLELGYITPKLGVQGVLINEYGQILLEKRKDDLALGASQWMGGSWRNT